MQLDHSFPNSRSGTVHTRVTPTQTLVGLPAIVGRRLTGMAVTALAFHYAQLEATAFREEFHAASFEDHTLPKNETIHKKAGPLIKEWTRLLQNDKSVNAVVVGAVSKRKPVSPHEVIFGMTEWRHVGG
jgi:Ku70/Ku80 C-terminal arm